jgi:hypothetical protein
MVYQSQPLRIGWRRRLEKEEKMTEQDKTAQFVFTVVIAPENKQYDVELWDFAGTEPKQLSTGSGSNWRTALGEALSKIELPTDKQEKTVSDLVKERAEDEGV